MEQTSINNNNVSNFHTTAPTIVTRDSKLKGELVVKGKLHIDGEMHGSLYVSSGVWVGITGVLVCEFIRAMSIVISGHVKSNLYAESVEIMEEGVFEGNLYCKKLAVENGSVITANCMYKAFEREQEFLDILNNNTMEIKK